MTRKKTIVALAIVSLMLLPLTLTVACSEGGAIADAAVPDPGDPAVYAPDGWPLQIGDIVTMEERDRLDDEFLSPHVRAIHVVGDRTYAAEWEWAEDHDNYTRLLYAGHFPFTVPWIYEKDEHELPERFHGKIEYDPIPPYTIPLYGGMRVDREGYVAWQEWVTDLRARREQLERERDEERRR